jgi:hypothetical protein
MDELKSFELSKSLKKKIKDKNLLFDTCAIIDILKLGVEPLLKELKNNGCLFSVIHPIVVELSRTDQVQDRVRRLSILDQYEFMELSLNKIGLLEKAKELQEELHIYHCHPDPEDIYLGATIATTGRNDLFLLTTNHSDFPLPVYKREGNIVIQNNNRVGVISLLRY